MRFINKDRLIEVLREKGNEGLIIPDIVFETIEEVYDQQLDEETKGQMKQEGRTEEDTF